MKALGARREVIARSFVAAAVILGTAGTIVGTVLGLLTSRALGEYVTVQLMGVDSVWTIAPWFVAASVAIGIGGTAAAALPAVLRATGVPAKDVLTNPGIDTRFGGSRVERAVSRATFLPRLTRIGLGNAARSRRRSIATAVQIALGVGTALGFAAFSVTGITVSNRTLENESGDIRLVWGQGGRALDPAAAELAAAIPGVAEVQPIIYGTVELGGDTRSAWGLPAEPIYEPDLVDGRWFSHDDIAAVAPVAVIGEPMAEIIGAETGDRIEIETRSGVKTVEVIGVDRTLVADGQYVWLPLSTAADFHQAALDYALWVDATDDDPGFVDAVAADLGAGLSAAGYRPRTFLHHEELATARAEDRVVVTAIMVLGLPIVAIAMIGLVSAMTTSMLERTREIGILRSLGASKRHLRSLLRAEGIAVAALGWVVGIPVGYVLARVIVWQFGRAMHTSLGLIFPWWLAPAALVLVVIAARLTLRLPMRRAVRMPPATALRYE
jgi:putative ABC transport system permease protein